jgi:hypothetical protein
LFPRLPRVIQPAPKPVPPDPIVALAQAVIPSDRFPVLTALDADQPRARPVSPARIDGFTPYDSGRSLSRDAGSPS